MRRLLIVCFLLSLTILVGESLKIEVPSEYFIDSIAELQKFNPDFGSTTLPGTYKLPAKQINIVLPPAEEITNYNILVSSKSDVSDTLPDINSAYSNSDTFLDNIASKELDSHYRFNGLKKWGNLNFASINWIPVLYSDGKYELATSCSIEIEYIPARQVNRTILKEVIDPDFFVNPNDIEESYYLSRDVSYLIIGPESTQSSLSDYQSFRESQGMTTDFVSTEYIYANTSFTNPVEAIRNFLVNRYGENPFAYLLLVGDVDDVPVAYLSAQPGAFQETASDFYYSDLTSEFDSDNDGILGEYSIDGVSQDAGMDFTPETFVGRIPYIEADALSSILNRIINFESTSASWKDDVLMPMSYLNYANENNSSYPISNYAVTGEYLKNTSLRNHTAIAMYEEEGVVPSSPQYPSDIPVTYDNIVQQLNNNNFGFVSWAGHGAPSYSVRTIWYEDTNNNGIPDGSELGGAYLVNSEMWSQLNNNTGSVFFCSSCNNGMLDNNESCVGEELIRYKAVANIAATRTSWYKVGWQDPGYGGLQSYNTHIVEYMFNNNYSYGKSQGMANFLHTNFYLFGDPIDSDGIIHPELKNIYTHLLFGDPAVNYQANDQASDGDILIMDRSIDQNGIALVNALNDNYNYNIIYSNKLITDYEMYNRFEAIFGLSSHSDALNVPLLNWEVDLLNEYYNNGGRIYFEDFYYLQNQIYNDYDISSYEVLVDISNSLSPLNDLLGNWNYNGLYNQVTPISANGSPLLTDGTHNFMYLLENGDSKIIVSAVDLIGFLNEADYSNFTSLIDLMDIQQTVANDNSNIESVDLAISNYPNPFNPETTISFNVENQQHAKLEIFNLKGQKVYSTIKDNLTSGRNTIVWKGNNTHGKKVSSGLYFYRLNVDGKSVNGKMMMVK